MGADSYLSVAIEAATQSQWAFGSVSLHWTRVNDVVNNVAFLRLKGHAGMRAEGGEPGFLSRMDCFMVRIKAASIGYRVPSQPLYVRARSPAYAVLKLLTFVLCIIQGREFGKERVGHP